MDLKAYWKKQQRRIDAALGRLLPSASTAPATIHRAMRYSLFAGGKRLRPLLCLAAAEAAGGKADAALPLACAVECIHTYSLIHDDLPCMDNDDWRRGKPTCHKVFGEGMAVLAGDALLTVAFEMAAKARPARRYSTAELVLELAHAAGSRRLIAGQVVDLENEGKAARITHAALRSIHENKTAALITTSIRLGAMSAGAPPALLKQLTVFGRNLGLAFQVIDDILDITQTSEQLGKSAGKDVASGKSTYPAVLGMKKAQAEAARLTRASLGALNGLGPRAAALDAIARFLLTRQN